MAACSLRPGLFASLTLASTYGIQVAFIDTFHLFEETHSFLAQLEVILAA